MVKHKDEAGALIGAEQKLRLRTNQSKFMTKAVEKLNSSYSKYVVPITELRKNLDKEMEQKTLTDELYKIREER
jgi:hypothetical protein